MKRLALFLSLAIACWGLYLLFVMNNAVPFIIIAGASVAYRIILNRKPKKGVGGFKYNYFMDETKPKH